MQNLKSLAVPLEKIVKLLQSPNKEDIMIGLNFLKPYSFEDLKNSNYFKEARCIEDQFDKRKGLRIYHPNLVRDNEDAYLRINETLLAFISFNSVTIRIYGAHNLEHQIIDL